MEKKLQIQKVYSLSPMQEGMLFHTELDKDSSTYFEQTTLTLNGHVDIELFEKCFNLLIDRHDALRTIFFYKNVQRISQVVVDERPSNIYFEDITHLDEEGKKQYIEEFKVKDREKGFDLSRDILIRVAILKTEEDCYKIIWSFHHIIMDGWCTGIINKEVFEIYTSLKNNKPVRLEKAPAFKDYIDYLEKLDKEEARNYWSHYLEGYESQAVVPGTGFIKEDGKFIKEEICFSMDKSIVEGLSSIARKNNTTLNTVFQAIWGVILQKYNNTGDVVFGAVTSGRRSEVEGIEDMLGLFINTVPIRVQCDGKMSFTALLGKMQEEALLSEKYSYFPLTEIQAASALKNALFSHMVAYENYPIQEALSHSDNNNTGFTILDVETFEQSNYDLIIAIIPGEELKIMLKYNSCVHSHSFMQSLKNHIREISAKVIEAPDMAVEDLEILCQEEKGRILFDFNNTRTDYPKDKTLQQLLEEQVDKTPDNIAVVFENQTLTYRELNERSNRLARVLREKGVQKNCLVALILKRSPEMIISIVAVLKAGGAYLPIDPEYPKDRVIGILNDSGTSLVLTQSNVINELPYTTMLNIDELKEEQVKKCVTATRAQITDLDNHPYPDRSLVNYDRYLNYIGMAHVKNSFAIQGSRGCPYNCAYCHKIWPKTHYIRSAENIFEEVKYLYDAGVRRFTIVDDIFNLDIKNSSRFFKMIIENKMKVNFFYPNGVRGDILTEDYIDLMVEAGTKGLSLALETASPRIQKLIGKNLKIDKLKQNLDYISAKHPEVILDLFWMIGFPTETEEEAMSTLNFVKSIKWLHFPVLSILKIYPNTDMEKLALENGVSVEAIKKSCNIAYHELPDTLPFPKEFARQIQASFLNDYFLSPERLTSVLDIQRSFFTNDELLQKYNSYLPEKVNSVQDIMRMAGVHKYVPSEIKEPEPLPPIVLDKLYMNSSKAQKTEESCQSSVRILLLDLSQYFSGGNSMLYDVAEPPFGQMYLMTYLNKHLGGKIEGKVLKSRFDFNSYDELKEIITEFKPDIIGARSLTFYKDFFHKTIAFIRQWGVKVPIVAGGPYATSDYLTILNDRNVDLVIRGEGEVTLYELMIEFIKNNKNIPHDDVLSRIDGIAFVQDRERAFAQNPAKTYREILMLDGIKEILEQKGAENLEPVNSSEDLAYVMYTSGSTGKPKGNLITHYNISRVVKNTNYIDITDKDTVLQLSNYSFDGSTFDIYGALLNGAKLVMVNQDILLDVAKLSELIKNEGITLFFVTTALFNALVDVNIDCFKTIRKVLFGGERVSVRHVSKAFEYMGPGRIIHVYGPTESTVYATYYNVDTIDEKLVTIPIGKPLANTFVYITDSKLKLQPVGVPGEICISGDGIARGYLNRLELTSEKFVPNPFSSVDSTLSGGLKKSLDTHNQLLYRTGDLARWLPDGNIEFLDRIDTQVKLRGFRIELGEIESQLLKHDNVKEAVVLCREDSEGNKFLYAYIVADTELSVMELRDYLSRELPDYMIPSYFSQLDSMPLTPNGKVDKKALISFEKMNSGIEYIAPSNEIEKALAGVWEDVLGVKRIGVNDNYFSQGGDSIKAIQIASRLQKQQLKMEIKDLFQHPTIRELSSYIKVAGKKAEQGVITGEVPLTPIQNWFFREQFTNMHHFNHSVMLHSINGFDDILIGKVFGKIVEHHDALRMVYKIENERIIQYNRGIEGHLIELEIIDLSNELDCTSRLEEEANRAQSGINLAEGPLVKLRLFKTAQGDHLLVVIHHLVIDGVSWRIILEDFTTGYLQASKGQEMVFQDKTNSFKDWAEKIGAYAVSGKMEEEAKYWENIMRNEVLPLPKDCLAKENRIKDSSDISLELSEEETEKLLKDVNAAYNTEINDILISALGMALKEWCGHDRFLISLEGHGREDIIEGIDINRTVGWFSSVYPVVLDMEKNSDISYCIKSVKDELNRIPDKGIGYGILEFLSPDRIKGAVEFGKKPEISFNYLGQFDQDIKTEVFDISEYSTGDSVSPEMERRCSLDINGLVKDNKLRLTLNYNCKEYKEATVATLAHSYKNCILSIIDHCVNKGGTELTPTDLLYNDLTIEDLDDITNDLADILD